MGFSSGSSPEKPVYNDGKLTYGSYLKVPELLDLQQFKADPGHPDELLFIIAHQVYELWFKQLLHELVRINAHLDADEPLRAAQLFERVLKVQHLLIEQIPLLETMFAVDFAKFRHGLGTSSGFQSVQFRRLEFLCGNKNPKMLALIGKDDDQAVREQMQRDLAAPTPYDHFLRHLSREDNGVFKIPAESLSRDTSQPHALSTANVDALETLYRLRESGQKGERYYPQFRVAEHLLEFDEKMSIWRFHHVKMVERMIGTGMGTGGSSGAKYLRSTLEHPFFPDLWALRDRLGAIGGAAGHTAKQRESAVR